MSDLPSVSDPPRLDLAVSRRGCLRGGVAEACDLAVAAFHRHVLPHAEGHEGMFGMVTALIVRP